MKQDTATLQQNTRQPIVHSKKFILWLFIVSIVMLFASMTSAYIVRSADGEWLKFSLPSIFAYSTVIILLSSFTIQWAYTLVKKDQLGNAKLFLSLTLALGLVFLYTQLKGWGELVDINVYFGGSGSNPAGSFVYVLSGLHGFHLVTGLIYIAIVLFQLISGRITQQKSLQIELCTTYWHFLDLLWIYLFVFLQVNN